MSFEKEKELNTPLLKLSADEACAGNHVWGGVGAGKSSSSGRALLDAFLRSGIGGLVTTAKPDELELWRRYAQEHGRGDSLITFGKSDGED